MMKKTQSLRDHVRSYISEGIYDGSIKPGDRINEQSVADMLNMSRTPAREALMQLCMEGILDYAPRRGFSIRQIGDKEKLDMYEVTALLDAYAAKRAMPFMTEADVNKMNEFIEKIDVSLKYRNISDYRILQRRFHDVYRRRYGNDVLLGFLDRLESGVVSQIYEVESEDAMYELYGKINEEHRTIVTLFEEEKPNELFDFLLNVHWAVIRG